jgi:hypothetical protein
VINRNNSIQNISIGALKGKTTRQNTEPVAADCIEIPKELIDNHSNATLCIDSIEIIGVPFSTAVSRNIMYRTAKWVQNQTAQAYRSVLDGVV